MSLHRRCIEVTVISIKDRLSTGKEGPSNPWHGNNGNSRRSPVVVRRSHLRVGERGYGSTYVSASRQARKRRWASDAHQLFGIWQSDCDHRYRTGRLVDWLGVGPERSGVHDACLHLRSRRAGLERTGASAPHRTTVNERTAHAPRQRTDCTALRHSRALHRRASCPCIRRDLSVRSGGPRAHRVDESRTRACARTHQNRAALVDRLRLDSCGTCHGRPCTPVRQTLGPLLRLARKCGRRP